MRPILFFIGLITTIYVIAEWIGGHIQYSIEGYVGNGVYGITHYFDSNIIAHGYFMDIVYLLTLTFGIILMLVGWTGERKKGGK